MPIHGKGTLCGKVLATIFSIYMHLEGVHKANSNNRPNMKTKQKHTELEVLDSFFCDLTKAEEYERKGEKGGKNEPVKAHQMPLASSDAASRDRNTISETPTPRRRLAGEDDEDDSGTDFQLDGSASTGTSNADFQQLEEDLAQGGDTSTKAEEDITAAASVEPEKPDQPAERPRKRQRVTSEERSGGDLDNGAEEDEEDLKFELKEVRLKRRIQKLQNQLQEVQVERRLAATRRRQAQGKQ